MRSETSCSNQQLADIPYHSSGIDQWPACVMHVLAHRVALVALWCLQPAAPGVVFAACCAWRGVCSLVCVAWCAIFYHLTYVSVDATPEQRALCTELALLCTLVNIVYLFLDSCMQ